MLRLSSSAVYLAQIGVQLTPSTVGWFADVKVEKNLLLAELSLSPLFLNDIVASILVNMAAREVAEADNASNDLSDGFVVSSYLSVLVMLIDPGGGRAAAAGEGLAVQPFQQHADSGVL